MDGKLSLKGAWSDRVNHLNIVGHQPHFRKTEARVVKFCKHVVMSSPSITMTSHP